MEKILLVINAHNPDVFSIDFACRVVNLSHTKLTGLFIENLYFEYIPVNAIDEPSYFSAVSTTANATVAVDTDQSIRLFKEECLRRGIRPEVYIDQGEPIREIIFESRFADLVIVDPKVSFYNREEPLPSHFVKEILAKAECPVLLAPERFETIEEIVFCYDGSASSVFAIKQLTYLLPQLYDKKAMLLEVSRRSEEEFTESHRRMLDWLRSHYRNVYYHSLKGDVKDELFNYFFKKQKVLIVIGAYGRSMLSNFFRKSNADVLIRMVDLPIFITHH
jgi:nucleotide-binding universal stress UspA family protein